MVKEKEGQREEWKDLVLKTGADRLLELVTKYGRVSLDDASSMLNIEPKIIEAWAKALKNEKLISLTYDNLGNLILESNKKTKEVNLKKIEEVRNQVEITIDRIEKITELEERGMSINKAHITNFEKLLKKDISEIEDLKEELENIREKKDELVEAIKKIHKDEEALGKTEKIIIKKGRKLNHDSVLVSRTIAAKLELIKKSILIIEELEEKKDYLKEEIMVIRKMSKALAEAPADDLDVRLKRIEIATARLKRENKELLEKFDIFEKLVTLLYK